MTEVVSRTNPDDLDQVVDVKRGQAKVSVVSVRMSGCWGPAVIDASSLCVSSLSHAENYLACLAEAICIAKEMDAAHGIAK